MIKVLKFTLLNHLFYYTEVSGGGASATITGGFIGDLALTYSFANALRQNDDFYPFRKQPDYSEIKDFGFYCTVGSPLLKPERTDTYIQNTLFNVDGFHDMSSILKSGKSPFKNFRQVQGIGIGNQFVAIFMSHENMQLPPVVRVGRAKETLLLVEEIDVSKLKEQEFWLNAFSLRTVFNNMDSAIKIMTQEQKINFSYVIEQYYLIKKMSFANVKSIFQPLFRNI
jgi:CRISPR-associated protein Csc1